MAARPAQRPIASRPIGRSAAIPKSPTTNVAACRTVTRSASSKRLEIGREHVKPWPVVPQRKFDGLEVGSVLEAARVPGKSLRAVIVGVELIDGQPVIRDRREAHHQCRAQQSYAAIISASMEKRGVGFLHETAALRNIGNFGSLDGRTTTSNPPIGANLKQADHAIARSKSKDGEVLGLRRFSISSKSEGAAPRAGGFDQPVFWHPDAAWGRAIATKGCRAGSMAA